MSQNRTRSGRHALLAGLAVSALIHVLVLLLNPTMSPHAPATTGIARAPVPPPQGQLLDFVVTAAPTRAAAVARASEPTPTTAGPVATTAAPSDSGGVRAAVKPASGRADADPGSRLRYRAGPVWVPPPPRVETCAQRVRRELTERLAKGIADRTAGVPPPAAGAEKRRFEAGIRIPFGPKPPGPAIVVPPPPPPDSFRSILKPQRDTVNPPLFAADSARCAAQERLEGLLRVRPDTLGMAPGLRR